MKRLILFAWIGLGLTGLAVLAAVLLYLSPSADENFAG